jgi:Mg/Co/Ni transporter MgtE
MNPDFALLPADATVAHTLERVRASDLPPAHLLAIWVIDEQGKPVGGVFSSELMRADGDAAATACSRRGCRRSPPRPSCRGRAPDGRLQPAREPVIDADGKPIGVISFDDVLERLIPEEWRRRAGEARE